MRTTVLAGGGLTSWFACGHLLEKGVDIDVLLLDVGNVEGELRQHFIDVLQANGTNVTVKECRAQIASFGLEIAQFQGRYPNGYWNTTSVSRACFASGALDHLQARDVASVAHGCVAFGNDQKRMDRLFNALDPRIEVVPVAANLAQSGAAVTRGDMIAAIKSWFGFSHDLLDTKTIWSIDGSIIGCAHEGSPIENMDDSWRAAPFLMTSDPFADQTRENVRLEIASGRVVSLNGAQGSDLQILEHANDIAGAHGLGRIGVMEDKISGNKCRGVYEAPGVTLLGNCFARLYEATFASATLSQLKMLSASYADDIYRGHYFSREATANRAQLQKLVSGISGSLNVLIKGGYMEVETIETDSDPGSIERRFHHGGTSWENVPLAIV